MKKKKVHGIWVKKRIQENEIEVKIIESYNANLPVDKDFREPKENEFKYMLKAKYEGYLEEDEFYINLLQAKYACRLKNSVKSLVG